MDANLLHISYEGDILEDPWLEAEEDMWRWTVSPEAAPDQAEEVELTFRAGDVVAVDGKHMSPAQVLETLNRRGGAHGIGRADIVENPLRRYEIPRLLRNAGGHDSVACSPSD